MQSLSMFGFALLLLAVKAFFNLTEMALVTVRPARLGNEASASANRIRVLKKRPGLFFAAVRAGDQTPDLITGAFIVTWGERELHQALSKPPFVGSYASSVGSIAAFLGVTYVFLVIADLMPKSIALSATESTAKLVAALPNWISRLAKPPGFDDSSCLTFVA